MNWRDDLSGLTVGKFLARHAEQHGDRCCVKFLPTGAEYTYGELDKVTNKLARGLRAIGVERQTNVAIVSDNRLEQLLSYFALGKLGAASVPVVTSAKGYFLQRFIGQSDSTAVIAEPEFLENLAAVIDELPQLKTLILLPSLEENETNIPPALGSLRRIDFADLMTGSEEPIDEASPSDLFQILYTSGTTGPSKGNAFPHTAVLAWGYSAAEARGIGADDVSLIVFPLFHAGAWLSFALTTLCGGGSVALGRRFSASRFMQQVRETGATVAFVSAVSSFLLAQPPSPGDREHRLRQLSTVPLPPNPVAFEERFGLRLTSGYALSDYGGSHVFGVDDPRDKIGSAGRLKPDWEMKIIDNDGREVERGEHGELLLRHNIPGGSPTGYYKLPEATLEVRKDLWFHTGDYVREDEDGFLWFGDRKKDAIRRRGENISSIELEAVLGRHPAVAGVAFYPVRAHGEEDDVAVAVVLKGGQSINEAEIVDYCSQNMPKFAVPRYVRFLEAFPQTGSGKIEKQTLRAETEASVSGIWDREASRVSPPAKQ